MKIQKRKQRDEIEIERAKLTDEMRREIEERDKNLCRYCGKIGNTIDHLDPLSRGGKTTYENCVVACGRCNAEKDNMTMSEYQEYLIRKEKGLLTEREKNRLVHLPKECSKCKVIKQLHHFRKAFSMCNECIENWQNESRKK